MLLYRFAANRHATVCSAIIHTAMLLCILYYLSNIMHQSVLQSVITSRTSVVVAEYHKIIYYSGVMGMSGDSRFKSLTRPAFSLRSVT